MNFNKFNEVIKTIMYVIFFILILFVAIKLTFWVFKILAIGLLIWVAYKGIKKFINFCKLKKEEFDLKKKGYSVEDDGIIDVKYEDVDDSSNDEN